MQHALRMGTHAERDYFLRGRSLFDAVFVNANLMEATRDATSVLLIRLKRPYLIDPITYAFASDPTLLRSGTQPKAGASKPRPRSTFQALAEAYALPIAEQIGQRRLSPRDFTSETFAITVDRVLQYQNGIVGQSLASNAEFIGAQLDGVVTATPDGLIPPYFVDDFSGSWTDLNLAALTQASETRKDQVVGMVAYDSTSSTLNHTLPLGMKVLETNVSRLILWPADLDEHYAVDAVLQAYSDLVEQLASAGRRVWAAYGGFFAILLRFRGLDGVSHGLGYGDKRQTEPVTGGGVPPASYYAKPVRDNVSIGTLSLLAEGLTVQQYKDRICECAICSELLDRGGVDELLGAFSETELRPSPRRGMIEVSTPFVYRLARFHYLLNRASEIQWVESGISFGDIAAQMRSDAEWAADRIGDKAVRHIERWLRVAQPD